MPVINVNRPVPLALMVAAIIGAFGAVGGAIPSTPTSSVAQAQSDDPQGIALPVTVCLDIPNWQRPSSHTQTKHLQAMPSYGNALEEEPLATMVKDWWSHDIFSFTTYGLSARMDPLYLSGVWTALESTWACYDGSQPEQINNGELAEVWLLHHRLLGVTWDDTQYVITVEPAESGLQLVQFPRQERDQSLPITLMTVAGEVLAVMSGDW